MNEFIGVNSIKLTQEEIDYLVQEVKDTLSRLNISCVESKTCIYNELVFEVIFKLEGLAYNNRDREKNTLSSVDTLKMLVYKYEGYSNKERLEIARKNNTVLKDIDTKFFNVNFYSNLRIRKYRHRYFCPHTKNNMSSIKLSLDSKNLWQEFYSYMVNIKAIKGR